MTVYQAPLDEMRFVLNELADLDGISKLPGYEEATPDLIDAILEEAGKLASEVMAPLNKSGDEEGCVLRTASSAPRRASPKPMPVLSKAAGTAFLSILIMGARGCRCWCRRRHLKSGRPPIWPSPSARP
jgi:hypothetical protein